MKKKTALVFAAILIYLFPGKAQIIMADVITTSGDYFKNSSSSLSWTLGEPVIETFNTTSNCLTQGFQQVFFTITAIEKDDELIEKINVFPNPSKGIINIISEAIYKEIQVELSDIGGKLIFKKSFNSNQGQIDLSSYSNSFYFLKITDSENKSIKTYKIQKVN